MRRSVISVLADDRHRELRREAIRLRLERAARAARSPRWTTAVAPKPEGAPWLEVIAATRHPT